MKRGLEIMMWRTALTVLLLFLNSAGFAEEIAASEMLNAVGSDPKGDKWAALSLVEATAKVEGIDEAAALVAELEDRFPEAELREKLVEACADLGALDCAYYEMSRIEAFNWRMRAMSQIASAYAEQGDMDRSRAAFSSLMKTVARDSPAQYRDQLLVGLLGSVIEFGFFDIGQETLPSIDDPVRRIEALFRMAFAAGMANDALKALQFFREAERALEEIEGAVADHWVYARGAVAAAAAGMPQAAWAFLEQAGEAEEWVAGQIVALSYLQGRESEANTWRQLVVTPQKTEWLKGLLATEVFKRGQCEEALARWRQIASLAWAAATLKQMAQVNRERMCVHGAVFVEEAKSLWRRLEAGSASYVTIGAQLSTTIATAVPPTNALWTGRSRWECSREPIIYPGWWEQKKKGLPSAAGEDSLDGRRTAGPSVVKLGKGENTRYYLYYMAESEPWHTRILRAEISPDDLLQPEPRNVALEFYGPLAPEDGATYSTDYLHLGPYYGSVLADLDENGEPARFSDGAFKPWFMYIATAGNNTGVAISHDGGITFALPLDTDINPIFPFEISRTPPGSWRRIPLEEKSKPYDQSGSGSATAIRTSDGRFHMFYTARMWNFYLLDDLGASASEVFHRNGHIPDHGIGYAESEDGLRWTRRTAMSLGATSQAARGPGRIVEPRFRGAAPGDLEYTVTRPMVFEDGIDPTTGKTRYRMVVSSLSSTYRIRTLHSNDLINWTWDPSPSGGLFGFGDDGSFDDTSSAYGDCIREEGPDGDRYMCWYTGNRFGHISAGKTGIGFCTMPVEF